MTRKATKRNPNDLTLRNLRALKRRVESLEMSRDIFRKQISDLWKRR